NKVDLYVSQILEDLNNGLTWLKRDDIGYGNIQEKYNAKDQQITMIRKHPKLKDAETNITVFNIIDDTKDERNTTVSDRERHETNESVERLSSTSTNNTTSSDDSIREYIVTNGETSVTADEELSA
ncbi:MAG: hypothetical protein ACK55I_05460, partial [bacterium]